MTRSGLGQHPRNTQQLSNKPKRVNQSSLTGFHLKKSTHHLVYRIYDMQQEAGVGRRSQGRPKAMKMADRHTDL